MPPPFSAKQSARMGAGAGLTTGQGEQQRDCRLGQGPRQFPENLRASGLIAHAEHVEAALRMAERMPNETGAAMLRLWGDCLERMPYVVIGGRLHAAGGYVVGGLAGDWERARALFTLAMLRFSEIAEAQGADFSSAWLLAVDAERADEIKALIAASQAVAGHA